MLDKLLCLLNLKNIHQINQAVAIAANVIKALETEYSGDVAGMDAAIDALADLLKGHKSNSTTVPESPVNPS